MVRGRRPYGYEFSSLGKEQFDAFRELLGGGHPAPTPYDPRAHQKIALEKVGEFFEGNKNTRGKIIHPCGSGKSLTGYWISQALKSKNVIIAVPSLALVRQTLGSWTREAVANNIDMDWIAVCSDDDVKNSDDPSMHKVDLGIEVDTDPDVVAAFLSKRTSGTKVLITTYQSGQAVSEGVKKAGVEFDLGVYDEAHKTVGQKDKAFAHLLYDENVKVNKRVFMTATERQFRGNSDEYLSMDDEDIYGSIIHELSFKAALEQNPPILSDYKIVTTIVTKSEIDQLINSNNFVKSDGKDWSVEGDASTFAGLIALRKLVKERDIKHVVSFHSSIKRSKGFMELNAEASKADSSFGDLSSFHVSGKDSTGVRAATLERFVDVEPSLITNARCLTEGVDVPAIDAVLFADPKQSKIDIVQAAGRALRQFDGKDFGYIIVPVVLDDEAEDPSDDAFKQIITVISALGMHDERIIEEFKEIANGTREGNRIVEVDIPDIVRVKFEDFISNVEIQIWDRLSYGWDKGFNHLETFSKINGHCMFNNNFITDEGFRLGSWASSRRREYVRGVLPQDKILILEALPGWVWRKLENQFENRFSQLVKFVQESGHSHVNFYFVTDDGFKLGHWANAKRREYRTERLSEDKIARFEALPGWFWDWIDNSFEKGFSELRNYVEIYGHSRCDRGFVSENGFNLGVWVQSKRSRFNKGKLSGEQIKRFEALPKWSWNIKDENFQIGIKHLEDFVQEFGHARVPENHICTDGYHLGSWTKTLRINHRNRKLEAGKSKLLLEFHGWVWDLRDDLFEQGFIQLGEYINEFGNALPKAAYTSPSGFRLGSWCHSKRMAYKNGNLSDDHYNRLDKLPLWVWEPKERLFDEGFQHLQAYAMEHGAAQPTVKFKTHAGYRLGAWCHKRRQSHKNGTLSVHHIQKLEKLPGWVWNPNEQKFEEGFEILKTFVSENGHGRPAATYSTPLGYPLGHWVRNMRVEYKKGSMPPERVKLFEELPGWVWVAR